MEIALAIIFLIVGLAVGVPLVTMALTDFNRALPPGNDGRRALPPGEGEAAQYEVYDEATGTYSIVPAVVADDMGGISHPHLTRVSSQSRLTKVSPPADRDVPRASKRALSLVNASAAPVKRRKDALDAQVSSFEKTSAALDADLKRMFSETSITYDVHASAVSAATDRFWANIRAAADVLKRFDAARYSKLQYELSRSERLMFDSFDAGVLADQMLEALGKGGFDLSETEKSEVEAKAAQAKELAAAGKQLQARELLASGKELIVAKTRESNPAYIQMKEMEGNLSEADDLYEANDGLVRELERLSAELRQVSAGKRTEKTDDITAEIARLSDNAHLYS